MISRLFYFARGRGGGGENGDRKCCCASKESGPKLAGENLHKMTGIVLLFAEAE